MAVSQCRQKPVSEKNPLQGYLPDHTKKIIPVLGFGTDEDPYSLDLNEALDVIRDLLMVQSKDSRSITGEFIRKNRRKTIVFNLARCLAIMGDEKTGRKNTSFLLLDEQIADSRVGILVPGIHSIRHEVSAGNRRGCDPKASSTTCMNSIVRNKPPQKSRGTRDTVALLDLRELVDTCISHLKCECPPRSPDGE